MDRRIASKSTEPASTRLVACFSEYHKSSIYAERGALSDPVRPAGLPCRHRQSHSKPGGARNADAHANAVRCRRS